MIPFPDYAHILGLANTDPDRMFTSIEDEGLAINHAIVGSELAEDWLLPEDVTHAIRYHHEISALQCGPDAALSESTRQLIAVAQTAEFLIQEINGRNKTQEWGKLGAGCLRVLSLSDEELQSLLDDAREIVLAEM